jgi:sialic acid synthase SpsE
MFLSTPFDEASADVLDGLGVPGFKIGSGELTNLPFLAALARRGRPLIVSTGMATMVEVAAAVDAIRATGERQLALLHCVSSYPAAPADANLAAMATMRQAFGLQTGWSDHTPGIELPVAATALGAAVVEKHLTLDRARKGPDHAMSLEPTEFAAMVAAIRSTSLAVGDGDKAPTAAEREIAAVARRSLHWTRDLPAGTTIEAGHLAAQRPGTGISPARGSEFIGRTTNRPVTAGTMVEDGDA